MVPQYDVCLSFAGEDREYVENVAASLNKLNVSVFYDRYEASTLWGKNLYEHLDLVYRKLAKFCVVFASAAYTNKVWARHELASAQARAITENREYILPARFDTTEIPGILPTTGYIDLRVKSPHEVALLIANKISSTPVLNANAGSSSKNSKSPEALSFDDASTFY